MLEINLDDTEFKRLAEQLPEAHKSAAASVLRSVSYELSTGYRDFARTNDFGPFSPLTYAMRKGFGKQSTAGNMTRKGYGQWIGDFSRYFVDPDQLTAVIGILSKDDIDVRKARFEVISRGFARSAKRHAAGFRIQIDKARQRSIAKALMRQYGKDAEWIHTIIPRIGAHQVKARPVAYPVYQANKAAVIRTCMELYKVKMAGLRYSSQAARNLLNIYTRGYA